MNKLSILITENMHNDHENQDFSIAFIDELENVIYDFPVASLSFVNYRRKENLIMKSNLCEIDPNHPDLFHYDSLTYQGAIDVLNHFNDVNIFHIFIERQTHDLLTQIKAKYPMIDQIIIHYDPRWFAIVPVV